MTDKQAFNLIGHRTRELAERPDVQETMLKIAKEKGKEEAEKWVYMLAIATLSNF